MAAYTSFYSTAITAEQHHNPILLVAVQVFKSLLDNSAADNRVDLNGCSTNDDLPLTLQASEWCTAHLRYLMCFLFADSKWGQHQQWLWGGWLFGSCAWIKAAPASPSREPLAAVCFLVEIPYIVSVSYSALALVDGR